MVSFTFSCVALILIFICILLALTCVFKVFWALFPDQTYYETQMKFKYAKSQNMVSNTQSNDQSVDLSVIYKVQGEAEAIKEQMICISSLIKETFGENMKFEIVCVGSESEIDTIKYLNTLVNSMPFVVPILRSTDGLKWLISGIVNSNGSVIVDAQFITNLSESDMSDQADYDFINIVEPIASGPTKLFTTRDFVAPVAMSRRAAAYVFKRLHMLNYGSSNEILYLCERYHIKTNITPQNFGPKEYPLLDILLNYAAKIVTKFLYKHNFWTTSFN